MKIVNPVARPKQLRRNTMGISNLEGKNVSLFGNGWSSWDVILEEMERILIKEYRVKQVKKWRVPLSSAADKDLLQQAADLSDVCIVGLGN